MFNKLFKLDGRIKCINCIHKNENYGNFDANQMNNYVLIIVSVKTFAS
jgi:hypothetical protein